MPSNEDPFSEAIQLKKAKKRLLGALLILIGLLILSYFFLEDRSFTHNQNIKISFIDENDSPINNSIDQSSENFEVDSFFIQVGIFSDKEKTLNLLSSIQSFGIDCTLENIELDGKKMFRVKTGIFESYTDAETALEILKSNKFSGIIKKYNS
ncbi:MAG: SPOR domain-containing protein [Methylophilaceae bacterium]